MINKLTIKIIIFSGILLSASQVNLFGQQQENATNINLQTEKSNSETEKESSNLKNERSSGSNTITEEEVKLQIESVNRNVIVPERKEENENVEPK